MDPGDAPRLQASHADLVICAAFVLGASSGSASASNAAPDDSINLRANVGYSEDLAISWRRWKAVAASSTTSTGCPGMATFQTCWLAWS
eukprot:5326175-Lingulodinium_polyedra.AAC.1